MQKHILILVAAFTLLFSQTLNAQNVTCSDDKFWGIFNGNVFEFTLNNGVATLNPDTVAKMGGLDLAVANNLAGGNNNPVFYTVADSNSQVQYYDGAGWVNIGPDISPEQLYGAGGSGDFLYFTRHYLNQIPRSITRFNGNSFTDVYTWDSTTRWLSIGDLAVDTLGNVYIGMGPVGLNYITDTIVVVSPAGDIVKKYPLSLNTDGVSGMVILHNKLYIYYGAFGGSYSHQVLPVTLTLTTATPGSPITIDPNLELFDLASCNATMLATKTDQPEAIKGVNIFPNPANDEVVINWEDNTPIGLRMFDMNGRQVIGLDKVTSGYRLNTAIFNNGLYLIQVLTDKGIATQKLIVEH